MRPWYYENENVQPYAQSQAVAQPFIQRVFQMMAVGLGITALASFLTLSMPGLLKFAVSARWLLFFAEIGLVFYLAGSVMRMNPQTAMKWFLGYSALNGLTLAPIFLVYTQATITSAFFVSAGMFGAMAFWGATTKKDLSALGSILFMGLIGVVIASLVNLFLESSGLQLIISYAAVGIFTGLTAWDVQKLKRIAQSGYSHGGLAVLGALQLYLDFINLFLHMLYIMGGRRGE